MLRRLKRHWRDVILIGIFILGLLILYFMVNPLDYIKF